MNRPEDNDLRELFARARAEDRQYARDFESLFASASSRRARGSAVTRRAASLLAAASVVFAVAFVALRDRNGVPESRGEAVSLKLDPGSTRWESPTDFLLATPGDALLRSMPTLRYSAPHIIGDSTSTSPPAGSPAGRSRRISS